MATTIRARIYARGDVSFAKFLFLPSWFAKLLEANFSCFAKIIWMPRCFAKLLELLQVDVTRWRFSQDSPLLLLEGEGPWRFCSLKERPKERRGCGPV
jgi:hypothetical protein